jgi:hypothetical protein
MQSIYVGGFKISGYDNNLTTGKLGFPYICAFAFLKANCHSPCFCLSQGCGFVWFCSIEFVLYPYGNWVDACQSLVEKTYVTIEKNWKLASNTNIASVMDTEKMCVIVCTEER